MATPHSAMSAEYDVVIMGGGPGGATLAALLCRDTDLRVAIFEREEFPRDHIGESMAHPLIPVLEQSGALPKVLASDCYVQKFGGIFHWCAEKPFVLFFEHADWQADGVHRWAMHVNRAEFDTILLDHAESCGAHVFQGAKVTQFRSGAAPSVIIDNDVEICCRFFVDASGRENQVYAPGSRRERQWLSAYRNVAIWSHFRKCLPAQTLPGEWNHFREPDLSPICCVAFEHGWVWYIPTPQVTDGRRERVWSIGIVTNPEALREVDLRDPEVFMATLAKVPLIGDLIHDAEPIRSNLLSATNYSRISDHFASYDERWLTIGDASYFVDPLFSSGVAFAAAQARAAALVLRTSLDTDTDEQTTRDIWRDYDVEWHGMAKTFALGIDQWYHEIARNHPGSSYWTPRGNGTDPGNVSADTFQALLNTALVPDLLHVMTAGSQDPGDLATAGPYRRAVSAADAVLLEPDNTLALAPHTRIRSGSAVDIPGFKGMSPPFEIPQEARAGLARYWTDPIANANATPAPLAEVVPCQRFYSATDPDVEVRCLERDAGEHLWQILSAGPVRWSELAPKLTLWQGRTVKRLIRAGLVTADPGREGGR
ncbi:NAD(P)/FAD-dependent oxidoreductase [Nocardia suismassiliense]|uniref:NAD(P)/FAD-dependent oxidoreductase n=1 Tax=Nocardia suismassiliense TaxID=2077092 RepID=A0ABW6R160_9NOCA